MRGIFGSDSRLMKVLGKIFDIGYLSIVFIIFSTHWIMMQFAPIIRISFCAPMQFHKFIHSIIHPKYNYNTEGMY